MPIQKLKERFEFSDSRRTFLFTTLPILTLSTLAAASPLKLAIASNTAFKAVAFDGFAIFDPRPVFALTEKLFPEKGKELVAEWRTRQFEYTWLRTAGNQYKNFKAVIEDALVYAAKKVQIELCADHKKTLTEAFLTLNAWPDVVPTLDALKKQGIKLALLSNMTADMLNSCAKHAGIAQYFDAVLSTDKVQAYKPSPLAYQMGTDSFKFKKEQIAFVAFAGWDAAGAKWFGYPTYWANRMGTPVEELDVVIDKTGSGLSELVGFVGKW